MDHFEYVMVLISIIIGLGITHILLGVTGIIDRTVGSGRSIQLSATYLIWLAEVFNWMILFWWWEFRFSEFIDAWTLGIYVFLASYAIILFLLAAILVPRSWESVEDLAAYFLQRKNWFFSLYLLAIGMDVVDTYWKGGPDRIFSAELTSVLVLWTAQLIAGVIGLSFKTIKPHLVTGLAVLLIDVASALDTLPTLGF